MAVSANVTVNYWYIWDAFSELERAEAESGQPLGLDPDSETSMIKAFSRHVAPWAEQLSPRGREALKITMAYFLKMPRFNGDQVLAQIPDLTMGDPTNQRLLFEWMWRALYGEVDYMCIDMS